jgi:flagellar basal body rod protein FlgC
MSNLLSGVMRTIGGGLSAQRKRMEVIASNIANSETTRTENGLPYRKQTVRIMETEETNATAVVTHPPRTGLRTTSPFHMTGRGEPAAMSVVSSEATIKTEVVEAPPDRVKYIHPRHAPPCDAEPPPGADTHQRCTHGA